jgi:hypothetical protein
MAPNITAAAITLSMPPALAMPAMARSASCALFEGIDVQAAYELAGFKRPRGNAQRMEREPLIRARVNYCGESSIEPIC